MRKWLGILPVVLALSVIGWLVYSTSASQSARTPRGRSGDQAKPTAQEDDAAVEHSADAPGVSPTSPHPGRAERDRMRQRIVEALRARDAAAADDGSGSSGSADGQSSSSGGDDSSPSAATSSGDAGPDPSAPQGEGLTDRTGRLGYLGTVLNEELMPLVDECYGLAQAQTPELAGLLVVDLELIGDEEIGGVIETVNAGQDNELGDPELLECVRESIFATTLPPPAQSGRESFSLSLRLSPDE